MFHEAYTYYEGRYIISHADFIHLFLLGSKGEPGRIDAPHGPITYQGSTLRAKSTGAGDGARPMRYYGSGLHSPTTSVIILYNTYT